MQKPVGSGDLSYVDDMNLVWARVTGFFLFVCLFSDQFLSGMRYQAELLTSIQKSLI